MKRNIITTIKFSTGQISLSVLEKLPSNMVEIFNKTVELKLMNSFIDDSLKKIRAIIGAKITEVIVIIEPTKQTKSRTFLHREIINITGDFVTEKDIDNALQITKNSIESNENRVILNQPIKFDVLDKETKSYNQAPIKKRGCKLTVVSTITTVSVETYDYVSEIMKSHNLKISQVFLTSQLVSQNNLSYSALLNGAVLIHIGENHSFITINKNLSTIASMSIFDFGYKNLINGIRKIFGCSKEEASEILLAHANLDDEKINRVIYSHRNNTNDKVHYSVELQSILKSFLSKLLLVAKKYIDSKSVNGFPVILSGKLNDVNGIEKFAKANLSSFYVSTYNPLSFIEMNSKNVEGIGTSKFMDRMNQVLGKQFNTILETNPNLISTLKKKTRKKRIFAKFIELRGGKHERI